MPIDHAGDSLSQARTIRLQSGNRAFKDWVGKADHSDYYKFRLRRSSNVNIALSQLRANANVELLTNRGRAIDRSTRRGRKRESLDLALEPGTYYVRVYRDKGNTKYKLRLSVAAAPSPLSTQSSKTTLHPFVQRILDLTNLYRQQVGFQPLTLNQKLTQAAQAHSENMASSDFVGHVAPDGSNMSDRIRATGYRYWTIAENVAAGYSTPDATVEGWMNSPGHRANILNPDLKEIGIGYYHLANDTGRINYDHYWTQDFGTPFS
ncbi:MAG: CAP domain-containing protein [Elainellaceae cyanobacterium]